MYQTLRTIKKLSPSLLTIPKSIKIDESETDYPQSQREGRFRH